MSITHLSTEILQKIYEYATIKDVLNLSQTSKKNYNAYLGRQLPILRKAIYNSPYSPFPELVKLVIASSPPTSRNKSLGTEIRRRTAVEAVINSDNKTPQPLSLQFVKKMVEFAHIASRWVEIYPQLRWRYDSSSRRLLRPHEAFRLRKAIYQLWTYDLLFHDEAFCSFAPEYPSPSHIHNYNPYTHNSQGEGQEDLRTVLAKTWSTVDVIRQSEFVAKMRGVIDLDLFPSNDTIQYQYSHNSSNSNSNSNSSSHSFSLSSHNSNNNAPLPPKTLTKLAWGSSTTQRLLSDACLKLTPAEILHLYLHTETKSQRAEFIAAKGQWFLGIGASWDKVVWDEVVRGDGVESSETEMERACVDRVVMWGIIDIDDEEGECSLERGMASCSGDLMTSGEEWRGLRAGSTSDDEDEYDESEDEDE